MERRRLLYIGNKLARSGATVTSIETLGSFLEQEGYTVYTASSQRNQIVRLLDMFFTVIRRSRQVSVVLIDTYSTRNFYYAVIIAALCRLFGLPYIPILHGGNLPNRLKRNKGLSEKLFGKAFTNVAPSKYMMQQFKDGGFQNITYIPNAIEVENYPFRLRKSIAPKLLWVRSFSEIYNPLLALEIVELLRKKGMEVSLCMVGPDKDGSLGHCKKVVTELNLPVSFAGRLPKKEWIELSKAYDIFINSTNFDNMPVSVIEAMALGLPVISTNVGGLPYLIEHEEEGILVPPNNPEVFVDAIEELCNNSLKSQKISLNARAKVENFDWKIIKLKWFKLLDV